MTGSHKDVEELFETTSVDEIRVILTGLEREMDSKREELRTLVGERYRDLMEAANTIAQMKDTCKDVVESIAALTEEDTEPPGHDEEKAAEDNIRETQSDLILDDSELGIAS